MGSTAPSFTILITPSFSTTNNLVSPGGEVTKRGSSRPLATGSRARLVPETGAQELTAASALLPAAAAVAVAAAAVVSRVVTAVVVVAAARGGDGQEAGKQESAGRAIEHGSS